MIFSGLISALIVALILTGIVSLVLKSKGPWGTAWSIFVFLFLALWAFSLYIRSMGPVYFGVPWLPIVFAGVLLALFLLAIPNTSSGHAEAEKAPAELSTGVGKFFWALMAAFIIAIIIGMVNPQMAH